MKVDRRGLQLQKGYQGQFLSQMRKGNIYQGQFLSWRIAELKSWYWTDETDASRTPNVNTGDTYYNYEIHRLISFSVRATNDV